MQWKMTMTTANTKLNVLVACESSGTVRDAFRKLGHNAWSCDLLPCDTDSRFHIQGDALRVAANSYDRRRPGVVPPWDLIIAHPPCTYLCNSGVRWLYEWLPAAPGQGRASASRARPVQGVHLSSASPYQPVEFQFRNEARWKAMRDGADFFAKLLLFGIQNGIPIAVENPIMHRYAKQRILQAGVSETQATQLIQPYQFGHPESKATCLWLRGLPKLAATDVVLPTKGSAMWKLPPSKDRWKLRSKTYQGIADAMASQWSAHLCR